MGIAYTVIATFPSESIRDEYVRWLRDGHIDRVLEAGAQAAAIVRLDRDTQDDPLSVEVRYQFSSREVLGRYVAQHAPALRAEGLALFPPSRGVAFRRTIGEIV